MKISRERFNKVRSEAIDFYSQIKSVKCPYLQEQVAFNSKGIKHLRFKSWNRSRSIPDQYMRFKLLKFAVEAIKQSHTLQEYNESRGFEKIHTNSRWENKAVLIKYYGFVAIFEEIRVKVIVKESIDEKKFFWSMIPCWKQDRSVANKKIFHSGNLEED